MNQHNQNLTKLSEAMTAFRRSMMASKENWAGQLDLSHSQVHALMLLSDNHRQTTGDVAVSLCVTPSAATQTLDTLVRRGLVERQADETDRRVIRHVLSPVGKDITDSIHRKRQHYMNELVRRLTPEQLEAAIIAMNVITQLVDEYKNPKGTN